MQSVGDDYEVVHCSPESSLEELKQRLLAYPCDGVLLGGGVASDPEMSYFMEQIIDATHEVALQQKRTGKRSASAEEEQIIESFGVVTLGVKRISNCAMGCCTVVATAWRQYAPGRRFFHLSAIAESSSPNEVC